MYHSVQIWTFANKGGYSHVWDMYKDFFLVPTARPIISAPGVKTKNIEVPGANGRIDLTEALTPYPVFNNRSGSLEFAWLQDRYAWYNRYKNVHKTRRASYTTIGSVTIKTLNPDMSHDTDSMWAKTYSDLMNKIHGRRARIILEDDPEWYYDGRVAVGSWKTSNDGKWPVITINYEVAPYKLSIYDSTQDTGDYWQWSPFSFVDGVIYDNVGTNFSNSGLFKNIVVNSSDWVKYGIGESGETNPSKFTHDITGWMPVCPTVEFSAANMGIKIENNQLGYTYTKTYDAAGTYTDPQCLLYDYSGSGYTLYFKGTGTVTLTFRRGSL